MQWQFSEHSNSKSCHMIHPPLLNVLIYKCKNKKIILHETFNIANKSNNKKRVHHTFHPHISQMNTVCAHVHY